MRTGALLLLILIACSGCNNTVAFTNETRQAGYAMGEEVKLKFSIRPARGSPDSIDVTVVEKKTGYVYLLKAHREDCDERCRYVAVWDGRKPDGGWPAGGRYLVFAKASFDGIVYSDTVQIGLAD